MKKPLATYTIYPQQRFNVGRFSFVSSLLTLYTHEDVEAFQAVLRSLPRHTQSRIVQISDEKADDIMYAISQGKTDSVRIVGTQTPYVKPDRPVIDLTPEREAMAKEPSINKANTGFGVLGGAK